MESASIVIIDYGMGNLGSIRNMLKYLGMGSIISNDIADIQRASKLVISGVGAFDNAIRNINALGLMPVLHDKVINESIPVLGICLGMQLFTRRSAEGSLPGFGWVPAEALRFDFTNDPRRLKIPHMGWNQVEITKDSKLFTGMLQEPRFYFVHSYYCVCDDEHDALATTAYGHRFTSAIEKDNIYGVQFHPEKSHKYGMKLLDNFARMV